MKKVSDISPAGDDRLRIVLGKVAETCGAAIQLVKSPESRALLETKLANTQERIKRLGGGK